MFEIFKRRKPLTFDGWLKKYQIPATQYNIVFVNEADKKIDPLKLNVESATPIMNGRKLEVRLTSEPVLFGRI